MEPRAVQRPAARRDLINLFVYLAEHAGIDIATRFRIAVEATYADLAKMPWMGSPRELPDGRHPQIRFWPVSGFGNYWIAYRPRRNGVAIERLFHAKQDYLQIM